MKNKSIHPQVRLGHVHLKVSDIERALGFYRDVLGFRVSQRYGEKAVFLSAGEYHHDIGLNIWESQAGRPPLPGTTGLYHFALLYPTRASLANSVQRLRSSDYPIDGASDHGVSEAIYLRDPDQNGIELYWDRPKHEWPRDENGNLAMHSLALDVDSLLREVSSS